MTSGKEVRLWDGASGRPVGPPLLPSGFSFHFGFSPDGRWLLSVPTDGGSVRVFDLKTGKEAYAALSHGEQERIRRAAFSPDSRLVITAGDDGMVRFWDASTGRADREPLAHDDAVRQLALSSDGRVLVTATSGTGSNIAVWDFEKGELLFNFKSRHPLLSGLSVTSDGRLLLSLYNGVDSPEHPAPAVAEVRDISHDSGSVRLLHGARGAAFSPDGSRIVANYDNNSVRLWSLAPPPSGQVTRVHPGPDHDQTLSPDGRKILTIYRDGTFRLWGTATGKDMAPPWRHGKERFLPWGAFTSDGRRLLIGAFEENRERFWVRDAATGQPLSPAITPVPPFGKINTTFNRTAEVSPDGRRLAVADEEGRVQFWDVASGRTPGPPRNHSTGLVAAGVGERPTRVFGIAFSPDGKRLVSAGEDGTARVWDATTGIPSGSPLEHDRNVELRCARYSPDGTRIVTLDLSGALRLWDTATRRPALTPPMRHPGAELLSNLDVRFLPGNRIVSFGDSTYSDGSAQIWDAETGLPLAEPLRFPRMASHFRLSPDGRLLLASGVGLEIMDVGRSLPIVTEWDPEGDLTDATFDDDGRHLVLVYQADKPFSEHPEHRVVRLDLTPYTDTVEHWRHRAQAVSNRRLAGNEAMILLEPEGLRSAWSDVRSGMPRRNAASSK